MSRLVKGHLLLRLTVVAVVAIASVYTWNDRPFMARCVSTNRRCDSSTPCCNTGDICMISQSNVPADGVRRERCVTWLQSLALTPRLPNGATCTDSWQCADRCCREYRAHRRAIVRECGTPFDGIEWHTCATHMA